MRGGTEGTREGGRQYWASYIKGRQTDRRLKQQVPRVSPLLGVITRMATRPLPPAAPPPPGPCVMPHFLLTFFFLLLLREIAIMSECLPSVSL